MRKRDFLKITGTGGLASLFSSSIKTDVIRDGVKNSFFEPGFYIWVRPNKSEPVSDIKRRFKNLSSKGIQGLMFESDSPDHFKVAKDMGMQAHRWMWTMNRGEKSLLDAHPEWYAVNRNGVSCAENPPYVGYYRWLCPTKAEVQNYLLEQSKKILDKDYVDGIHLDYVRYCDVILAVNLWKKYNITQQKEKPEYDFCYCDDCRREYKEAWGEDPLELPYPGQIDSWRMFRYGQVSKIVESIASLTHEMQKPISAAVFPTPEIARRLVRQDWSNWPLDAVFPMIYHGFYEEPPRWIGLAAQDGLRVLKGEFPMYAGIFLPDFKNGMEIETGIKAAADAGVKGMALFGNVDEKVLGLVERYRNKFS